jgi:restriction endonuclease S subunit
VRLKKDKVLPKFVLHSLGHIGFSTLEKMAEGQSGQIELSPETIKNIKIPLPEISIQEKTLTKVNTIEEKVSQNLERVKTLKIEQVEVLKRYL